MIIISGGFVTLIGLILMPVPGPGGLPVTRGIMEELKKRVEFLRFRKR